MLPLHKPFRPALQSACATNFGRSKPAQADAFSLTELLVVIAIIAILGSAMAVGIGKSGGPSGQSAANEIYAQLQAARTAAVMRNTPARLLIEKAPETSSKTQRMIVVTSTNANQWEAASPWTRLPQGTYVRLEGDPPLSTKGGSSNKDAMPETLTFKGRDFVFYEFSATGACEANAAARIVIGAGHHTGTEWVQQNKSLIYGLFLTRLGEPVFFEGPDHIKAASP